jgi:flagellar protein FliO/FliZ
VSLHPATLKLRPSCGPRIGAFRRCPLPDLSASKKSRVYQFRKNTSALPGQFGRLTILKNVQLAKHEQIRARKPKQLLQASATNKDCLLMTDDQREQEFLRNFLQQRVNRLQNEAGACRPSKEKANATGKTVTFFLLLAFFLFCSVTASADALTATNLFATTNTITAAPSALPDAGASVVRVFGALLLVIALFLGGVWLFRNWQRLTIQKNGGAKLNLIEVKSLGQRQALYVVGYQQQRMLLASTPAGITLVSHLPEAEETKTPEAPPKLSFAEAFQLVLNRKP